jgi:hypothetical protein
MKFTKMSLVAALLIGSSAFAIENVKVSGDANLFYATTDGVSPAQAVKNAKTGTNDSGSLFSKDASAADASLNLNVTADLVKNDLVAISAGAGYTVLSTLGLENNLVSNVWGGAHSATTGTGATYGGNPALGAGGAKVENANWINEAWIAATAGKTTAKIGRMALDTPLVFTETWSIEKNTFESAVVINQNIPHTTLVGAFVGNGNGTEAYGQKPANFVGSNLAIAPVVNEDGKFTTFGTDGAYAVGAINNSFKPLTVQAWYYDLTRLATAYWLQADLKCKKVPGLLAGAQYASLSVKDGNTLGIANTDASSTYALMLGYKVKDVATIKLAYSSVDDKGVLTATNTATSTGASKLYTEAWWNYGKVTQLDTNSYHVSVEGKAANIDLALFYTYADQSATAGDNDMSEVTLTAGKSFGPLDATLAYVYSDVKTPTIANDDETSNMIQAYLTLKF